MSKSWSHFFSPFLNVNVIFQLPLLMFRTNLLSAFIQIRIIGHMNDNMHGFAKPVPKDKHLASVQLWLPWSLIVESKCRSVNCSKIESSVKNKMVIIWNDETNAVKLTVYRKRILPAVDLAFLIPTRSHSATAGATRLALLFPQVRNILNVSRNSEFMEA